VSYLHQYGQFPVANNGFPCNLPFGLRTVTSQKPTLIPRSRARVPPSLNSTILHVKFLILQYPDDPHVCYPKYCKLIIIIIRGSEGKPDLKRRPAPETYPSTNLTYYTAWHVLISDKLKIQVRSTIRYRYYKINEAANRASEMNQKEEDIPMYVSNPSASLPYKITMVTELTFATRYIKMCVFLVCSE
jgi:hypothetical protein